MDHIEALERLSRLKETGVLTDAEFEAQKADLLKQSGNARVDPRASVRAGPAAETPVQEFQGSTRGWLFGSLGGWLSLLLCLVWGLGLLIILAKWLRNISARYELTTQRLLVRSGIILKRVDEIELFRIKDVRVDYSVINQITGIGSITIRSSDATSRGRDFVISDIVGATDIRETLRGLVDDARQRRGVREVDFDLRYA